MSSGINRPAMLAVHKDTRHAARNALKATFVIADLFSGHNAVSAPIIMPIDAGFAKLHIAKVAMVADLSCKKNNKFFMPNLTQNSAKAHRNLIGFL